MSAPTASRPSRLARAAAAYSGEATMVALPRHAGFTSRLERQEER